MPMPTSVTLVVEVRFLDSDVPTNMHCVFSGLAAVVVEHVQCQYLRWTVTEYTTLGHSTLGWTLKHDPLAYTYAQDWRSMAQVYRLNYKRKGHGFNLRHV